jgi:hypothetical protein
MAGRFRYDPPAKRKKNPPPPLAMIELEKKLGREAVVQLNPIVSLFLDGVLLRFDHETQFVLATAKGARDLAERLIAVAGEVEKKAGTEPAAEPERN